MKRERPDTAAELRHAEAKLLVWDERRGRRPCALQWRDTELLGALGKYRFLTTVQIADQWWPGCALQVVRRRLTKLFEAGYVERFRPQTIRGSYQWIYCLARDGHRAAQQGGELAADLRFTPRREQIFDYRYVVHDLRLNDWVIAYTRLLGGHFVEWHGPDQARMEPPKLERHEMRHAERGVYVEGLKLDSPRPIAPDAALDLLGRGEWTRLLVEYDRTRRVDKNFDKFRRYDSYLATWWFRIGAKTDYRPRVLFLCEDEPHLERFLDAADRELTAHGGYVDHERRPIDHFYGRVDILFGLASDIYEGRLDAYKVPPFPPGHEQRAPEAAHRRVQLPGPAPW